MAHSPAHSLASKQPRASLSSTSSAPPDASASKAALFLVLLGAQYGLQPLIARHCTGPAAIKSVVVLSTEGVKIGMAAFMLSLESRASRAEIARSWTLRSSFTSAAVPAALYALQVRRRSPLRNDVPTPSEPPHQRVRAAHAAAAACV
jgi:hypothetical protein